MIGDQAQVADGLHILVKENLNNASPGDLDNLGFDLSKLRKLRGIPSESNLYPHILKVLVALVRIGDQSEVVRADISNFWCDGYHLATDSDKFHV